MNRLYEIAERCVEKVGFFQTFPEFYANREFDDDDDETDSIRFVRQKGIVRTNCVDCLDRTNTAMYVIGKCAMAHQVTDFCYLTNKIQLKLIIFCLYSYMLLEYFHRLILDKKVYVKGKLWIFF